MGRVLAQYLMVLSYYTSFDYLGNPFRMIYGADAMVLIEINTLTWRRVSFYESANSNGLDNSAYLLDEVGETTHIRECATKQTIARRFNIKVRQRGFHKGDLVLKRVINPKKKGKLAPNWE